MRVGIAGLIWLLCSIVGVPVGAQQPKAVVSFTFDDGKPAVFESAFPILRQYRYPATAYLISGELDSVDWHMNSAQIAKLISAEWEIGSHTKTHPHLVSMPLSEAYDELQESQRELLKKGIRATSFASPYGEMSTDLQLLTRQIYRSHRRAWGGGVGGRVGLNPLSGFDPYELSAFEVKRDTDPETVAALLDEAIRDDRWLILMFHIVTGGPPEYDTQISTDHFRRIVELVAERQNRLAVRTVGQMTAKAK